MYHHPYLEIFPGHIEFLIELYDIVETLGGQVESRNDNIFLPLAVKCKLVELDDFSSGNP